MKILVFGAGAIGSAVGGFFSRRHEVTLLGRRPHLEAIQKYGLKISGIWGRHRFPIRKKSSEMEKKGTGLKPVPFLERSFDLILVTVKSYDTESAARQIRKIIGPKTLVLPLQNGLGNIETLQRHLPTKQVLGGRIITGMEVARPGEVKITVSAAPLAIGEAGIKKITPRVRSLVKEFSASGIPCAAARDIQGVIWAKVIYNCALNPLASLRHCHYGVLGETAETRKMMNKVVREIYAVARKARVSLEPDSAEKYLKLFYTKLLPSTYRHRPSMLQDLEKGRRTEIDALNGAIVRLGRRYRVPTPVNEWLAKEIKMRSSLRGPGRDCCGQGRSNLSTEIASLPPGLSVRKAGGPSVARNDSAGL